MNLTSWLALSFALGSIYAGAQQFTSLPLNAHYVERELHVPVPGSGAAGLDVLEVYVNTPGKHPLALITHGTSNDASVREHVSPWDYRKQAVWFAQRGYVGLVVVRRGYGSSGGELDGSHRDGCKYDDGFEIAGNAAADDLRNVAAYAQRNMPEVDAMHIVSSGVSTGGFSQVALTANPPPGLEAAINFAGGRGGHGDGTLCNQHGVEDAFHDFGRHSHIPMLWIYAENDKWFPPNFARRFLAAFQSGGGTAQFVLAPPDDADGHGLYFHTDAWSETVQRFLGARGLLPMSAPYPPPAIPNAVAPAGLGENGMKGFKAYLAEGPNKAFATNGNSWYGYSYGKSSAKEADSVALENCNRIRKGGPACFIVYRGDQPVVK
jgi:dienelactone hydrolase